LGLCDHAAPFVASAGCPSPPDLPPPAPLEFSPWAKGLLEAIVLFIKQYPSDERSAGVLFKSAQVLWRYGHQDQAMMYAQQLLRLFPGHKLAPDARRMLQDRAR